MSAGIFNDIKVSKYGFQNLLSTREIGELNGKIIYELTDSLIYIRKNGQRIEVPIKFQTDLASVPRVPIVFMAWGDRAHREAVLHDYVYRKDSIPVLPRPEGDGLFKEAMISRDQPWYIYHPMYAGVRLGGGSSYHKYPVGYQHILTAP